MSFKMSHVARTMKLKRGYYETIYGNTAVYRSGRNAWDLDARERIPVVMLYKYLHPETMNTVAGKSDRRPTVTVREYLKGE